MSKFVVVKFDNISTYGTNPYKCVPNEWISESDSNHVKVPYPTKFRIFYDFPYIVNRQLPIEGWSKYTGKVVHRTETYHEGLQFIFSQDPSYLPEELLFINFISANNKTPRRRRSLSMFGLRIRRRFCKFFKI